MSPRKFKLRERRTGRTRNAGSRSAAEVMVGGKERISGLLERAWELIGGTMHGNWASMGPAWQASAEAWRRDWSDWLEDQRPHPVLYGVTKRVRKREREREREQA